MPSVSVRNLSIRTKLFAGFGSVFAVSIITGVVLMSELGSVNAGGVYVGTKSLPSVSTIRQVAADMNAYRSWQLIELVNTSKSEISGALAQQQSLSAKVDRLFERYGGTLGSSTDTALWHQAQREWAAFLVASKPLAALAKNPHISLAQASVAANATIDPMGALSTTIDTWAQDNVASANASSRATRRRTAPPRRSGSACWGSAWVV